MLLRHSFFRGFSVLAVEDFCGGASEDGDFGDADLPKPNQLPPTLDAEAALDGLIFALAYGY